MEKTRSTTLVEIKNNANNKSLSLSFRNIYTCGWGFGPLLHSQFFPEHRDGLKAAIKLGSVKDVHQTLQNATKNDWFISGGVQGCHNNELRFFNYSRKGYTWNKWLKDNFKGTYIVYNGEPYGGDEWLTNSSGTRQFHIGYGRKSEKSVVMFYMSMFFMMNHVTNVSLLEKKDTEREHFLIYINSNCVEYRENAFLEIAKKLNDTDIFYGGKCNGSRSANKGLKKKLNNIQFFNSTPGRNKFGENSEIQQLFRFCLVMENSRMDGYISEKILNAFLGGCVPIYYGTEEVFDIFNPDAFIFYNISNPNDALDRLSYLENNKTAYEEVMKTPILRNEESYKKYFTLDGGLKDEVRSIVENVW